MEKVILDVSLSLDGFIAGLNDRVERPLGDGSERLFDWMRSGETVFSGEIDSSYNEFFKTSEQDSGPALSAGV